MPLIFTIPQSHCVIVERLGKFSHVKKHGLCFKLPFIDQVRSVETEWGNVANKRGFLIELAEQQTDTKARRCHTQDNVGVIADAVVYWKIIDPKLALYEIDSLPLAVSDSVMNALRANIGLMDFDTLLGEREELNARIATQLRDTTGKWGITISRVEIQEIATDDKTTDAMRQQMAAERRKKADILEAEGRSKASILEAEGRANAEVQLAHAQKEATILRAQGEAEARRLMASADAEYLSHLIEKVSQEEASRILAAQKYIDGFREISAKEGDKINLPSDFNGIYSVSQ